MHVQLLEGHLLGHHAIGVACNGGPLLLHGGYLRLYVGEVDGFVAHYPGYLVNDVVPGLGQRRDDACRYREYYKEFQFFHFFGLFMISLCVFGS